MKNCMTTAPRMWDQFGLIIWIKHMIIRNSTSPKTQSVGLHPQVQSNLDIWQNYSCWITSLQNFRTITNTSSLMASTSSEHPCGEHDKLKSEPRLSNVLAIYGRTYESECESSLFVMLPVVTKMSSFLQMRSRSVCAVSNTPIWSKKRDWDGLWAS